MLHVRLTALMSKPPKWAYQFISNWVLQAGADHLLDPSSNTYIPRWNCDVDIAIVGSKQQPCRTCFVHPRSATRGMDPVKA